MELGLTRIERPEGTWLILNPSKTRLRRAVGDGLRGLREGFERLGNTLDRQDREGTGWLERLRDLAHTFAGRIHEGLERIAEREASYKTLDETLQPSLTLAKAAAERLRDS